jgi:outer membrane protein assembly factor BamB
MAGRLGVLLLVVAAASAQDLSEDPPRKPLWRHSLAERDHRYRALGGKWWIAFRDREPARAPARTMSFEMHLRYPANRPRVEDGLVLYKDGRELVVRRLGSGTFESCVPRYATPGRGLFPVSKVRPGRDGLHEDIYRYRDYGGGTVTLGGGRIVVLEGQSVPHPPRWPYHAGPNLLTVYDLRTKKTVWAWERDLCSSRVRAHAREAWEADHDAHGFVRFLESGVVRDGTLHTLAVDAGAISLWSIELETGIVRSRTFIQNVPRKYSDSAPAGASLACDAERVYVATHLGQVVAVDPARPKKPLWRFGYEGEDYGFSLNRPLLVGERLIVAARDADLVRAFDRKSGRLLWTFKPNSTQWAAHVVGAAEGVLVVAGRVVYGVDLETGEVAWGPKGLDGSPFGRGFVGERYAHVPLTLEGGRSRIERFDLTNGKRPAHLDFEVGRLGNLSFADGRLVVANDEEVMCFSTVERALEGPPLERALVLALHGAPDEAADAFDRAVKEEDDHARDLALHHLLRLALRNERAELADRAERFANSPVERAQVELVRARLGGDVGALAQHGSTEVVLRGEVVTAAEAARTLRP